jgi:hypothetical protein
MNYYKIHSAHNKGIPHNDKPEKIRQSCLKAGVGKWNEGKSKSKKSGS